MLVELIEGGALIFGLACTREIWGPPLIRTLHNGMTTGPRVLAENRRQEELAQLSHRRECARREAEALTEEANLQMARALMQQRVNAQLALVSGLEV